MKTKLIFLLIVLAACAACNNSSTSYSDQLKVERAKIDAYILREGITVVTEEPKTMEEWGDNVYWQVPDADNFYFHLVSMGDTTLGEVETGDNIAVRFKRYALDEYADTLYNWSTQDNPKPMSFEYHPTMATSDMTCLGWQLAVKYMKYPKAQCKFICPSKLGFSDDSDSVTPYGYDFKRTDLQIK